MSTIEQEEKANFLDDLLNNLADKLFLLLKTFPDAFEIRSNETKKHIENRFASLFSYLAKKQVQLPKDYSIANKKQVDAISQLFVEQLTHFLDNNISNPQEKISYISQEIEDLYALYSRALLENDCEKSFWESFHSKWLAKQEADELNYAKYCYNSLDVPNLTSKVFNYLHNPYEVKHDQDIIVKKPIIYNSFPYFTLGKIKLSRTDKSKYVTNIQQGSLPFLLPREGVNIVTYDKAASMQLNQKRINALISNILYQTLLYNLPDIKIIIYAGNHLFNSYDGLLPQQDKLKDFITTFSNYNSFKNELEKAISQQPSDIAKARHFIKNQNFNYIYAIAMFPHEETNDRMFNDYQELMESVGGKKEAGVNATFVMEQFNYDKMLEQRPFNYNLEKVNLYSLDKGIDYTQSPLLSKFVGVEQLQASIPELDSAWDDLEDNNFRTNILKAIINPPKEQKQGELKLYFAEQANGDPFHFIYNKENANTIFLAGSPGSGKSVALKLFIRNACANYSPEELQLILVDLKGGVEMVPFAKLPHSQFVVSASAKVLRGIFSDLQGIMSQRLAKFVSVFEKYQKNCSNVDQYNDLIRNGEIEGELQARILLVVDECKSLFEENDKLLRLALDDLLRKGRAAGIHFFFATQTDERSQFGKDLFNYRIQMTAVNGRRTTTIFQGNSEQGSILNIPKISSEDEEFGPMKIQTVAEQYPTFENNAIILRTFPQITLSDFPRFKSEFAKLKTSEDQTIKAIAGIDFNNLRSLFTFNFTNFASQHLFIAGDVGLKSDNSPISKELDGFVNLLFASLLSQDCRVSVYDSENKFTFLKTTLLKAEKFDYTNEPEQFVKMVSKWKDDADGNGQGKHFLFISSVENFFKEMSNNSNSNQTNEIKETKFSSFAKAFSTPKKVEKTDISWDDIFATEPKTPEVVEEVVDNEEVQNNAISYWETGKIIKEYFDKRSENNTYLILQSAYPKLVFEENIPFENQKDFRYVIFSSVISTNARMERPENIMTYFSKSPNTEENKETFVAFDKFNFGELL